MNARILLPMLLILMVAAESTAQSPLRWRPGSILRGLGNTVQGVAQDLGASEIGVALDGQASAEANAADSDLQDEDAMRRSGRSINMRPRMPTVSRSRPPVAPPRQTETRAVSTDDVIKMVQSGLGESTIVRYIAANGTKRPLEVNDLIQLHRSGVSEPIIQALQTAEIVAAPGQAPLHLPPPPNRSARSAPTQLHGYTSNVERFGPSVLEP